MAGADPGTPGTSLAGVTRRVIEALEGAPIPYALGGALALGYHAPPRGTRDIDVNIFLPAAASEPAFRALASAGADIDPIAARERATARGDAVGFIDGIRIDVFVNSIPLHYGVLHRTE